MRVAITISALVLFVVLFLLIAGMYHNRAISQSPFQKQFLFGTIPDPLPDGFYRGTLLGIKSGWAGKEFDAQAKRGTNVFRGRDKFTRYPFTMEIGSALTDRDKDVLKIDYNIQGNLPWARLALDEVVQILPGHLLGKLHVRIIPFLPLTIGFFELEQEI